MRRLFIGSGSLALALVLLAAPASAQFAIGGGITSPSGDDGFGTDAKSGWMAEAAWSPWQNADETLMFWVEGLYGSNNAIESSDVDKATTMAGLATITYNVTDGGTVSPYVIASGGYFSQTLKADGLDNQTEGGVGFAGGVGVGFGGGFWIEGRYVSASINDETVAFLMFLAGYSF